MNNWLHIFFSSFLTNWSARVRLYSQMHRTFTHIHTCLLLILMFCHRLKIFELKSLSFWTERRIWSWEVRDTKSPADTRTHMHTYIHACIHTYIHTCLLLLISMLWHRHAIFKSKGDKLCSSAESRIWTRDPRHQFASRLNARWQTDWAIEDQAQNLNPTAVPMISEHSAHLAPLSVDFRTWLWRYICLLLLISMLWHKHAIFKSKGDKLCSSAQSRIWTRDPRHQFASRLNARWQTDWAIEDQAQNLNSTAVPMISEHSAHLVPLSVDFRTWHWRYTCYTHTHIHTSIHPSIHPSIPYHTIPYLYTYIHTYIHTYLLV